MTNININFLLTITYIIFIIGLIGILLNRKNILIVIMSIELILLTVNVNFIIFAIYLDDLTGHVYVIFILIVAAAESAVGLSIINIFYKLKIPINSRTVKNKIVKINVYV